ncbi:MAG: methyltransferase domain-containing protein [Acidimicrobiia bacterium]
MHVCNPACVSYGTAHLTEPVVRGRRVIEVGSRNVNGSLRRHVEQFGPASYLGVDIESGPGVDEVCDAEDLVTRYGSGGFDLVICTEVLEHVRNWRTVIRNLKDLLADDGVLLVTTRSYGFPYHAFPYDFWRYETDDMRGIFSDFAIEDIATDPVAPGVFLTARRPTGMQPTDLETVELYSMITRQRCRDLSDTAVRRFFAKRRALQIAGKLLPANLKSRVKARIPST